MHLASDFDYIKYLLQTVTENGLLTETDEAILSGFLASFTYQSLPANLSEAQIKQQEPLYLLKLATDMLFAFSQGASKEALFIAQEVYQLNLISDGFEGWFFRCVIKLAGQIGYLDVQNIFLAKYENYRNVYNTAFENYVERLSTSLGIFAEAVDLTIEPLNIPKTTLDFVTNARSSEITKEFTITIVFTDSLTNLEIFQTNNIQTSFPDSRENDFDIILDFVLAEDGVKLISARDNENWTIRLIDNDGNVIESLENLMHFFNNQISLVLKLESNLSGKDINWNKVNSWLKEVILISPYPSRKNI